MEDSLQLVNLRQSISRIRHTVSFKPLADAVSYHHLLETHLLKPLANPQGVWIGDIKPEIACGIAHKIRIQQDKVAAMSELQVNYRLNAHWQLVGFGGLGQAVDSIGDLGKGDTKQTIGGGFRYLIARSFGLRAGLDVAWGPEDQAIYIQLGHAWNM